MASGPETVQLEFAGDPVREVSRHRWAVFLANWFISTGWWTRRLWSDLVVAAVQSLFRSPVQASPEPPPHVVAFCMDWELPPPGSAMPLPAAVGLASQVAAERLLALCRTPKHRRPPSHPAFSPWVPTAHSTRASAPGLQTVLARHPLQGTLVHSIKYGVSWFDDAIPVSARCPQPGNYPSAAGPEQERWLDERFRDELKRGWLVPAPAAQFCRIDAPLRIAPTALVPKAGPKKFRPIDDMSAGGLRAANASMRTVALRPMALASAKQVVALALASLRQPGTHAVQGVTMDLESAYRNIPVAARCRWLCAVAWRGSVFLNVVMPFGARAAADWMVAHSAALTDVAHMRGIPVAAYFDDFFVLCSPPQAPLSPHSPRRFRRLLEAAGWPRNPAKDSNGGKPADEVVFLGLRYNLRAKEIAADPAKLASTGRPSSSS